MTNLDAIFYAGFVRRWHTNPDLAYTNDRIDGHSARVARIILALHPDPSFALIKAALIHDDGEAATGDMSAPAKRANPEMAESLAEVETSHRVKLWGIRGQMHLMLSAKEKKWLEFADRLDAYMWAAHHAPRAIDRDGWPEAKDWIIKTAEDLGCFVQLFNSEPL